MKKLFRIFTVLTVIALTAMSAACSKSADTAPTSAATAPPTEAATVAPKPTDPAAPTAAATVAPTEAPAAAPDTPADDDLSALTASRWQLSTVEHDGEVSDPMYYGSVIRQTGAYLQFNTDYTFSCVLGMDGCEGTYTLSNGEITVNITTTYDGKADKGYAADDVQTLPWNKEAGTIQLELNGVTNTFKQV